MENRTEKGNEQAAVKGPNRTQAKVVAEMDGDGKMRDEMKDMKETDGFSGSCGSGL